MERLEYLTRDSRYLQFLLDLLINAKNAQGITMLFFLPGNKPTNASLDIIFVEEFTDKNFHCNGRRTTLFPCCKLFLPGGQETIVIKAGNVIVNTLLFSNLPEDCLQPLEYLITLKRVFLAFFNLGPIFLRQSAVEHKSPDKPFNFFI